MCLLLNSASKTSIAHEDIEVYKVVMSNGYGIQTPYRRTKVLLNLTYHTDLQIECLKVHLGFHSFVKLVDAELECRLWNDYIENTSLNYRYKIVKCVIPNGSMYVNGCFSVCDQHGIFVKEVDSYASSQIKYIEIIK